MGPSASSGAVPRAAPSAPRATTRCGTPPAGRTSGARGPPRAAAPSSRCPCGRGRSFRVPWRYLCLLDVDSRNAAAAFLEGCVVAGGLRADQSAEAEVAARNRQLVARVVDDLQVEPGVRAALVQLARRVQIPRPVAVRHHEPAAAAQLPDEIRDPAVVLLVRLDERLHADVIVLLRLREQPVDGALRLEVGLFARREHLVRLVLRGLYIRLVERVDLEIGAGDGDRELPAEELAREVVRIRDLRLDVLAVVAVRRLARRGHEPLSLLPRRLGDQLLGPEAEAPVRLLDADLVAALLPARAELMTEHVARIAVVPPAQIRHALRVVEKALEVEPHQCGRDDPEGRERGIAPADRRLPGEDVAEVALARFLLEVRARIGDRDEAGAVAARLLPEVVRVRASLERAARLRRRDEQGVRDVDRRLEVADRLRVRRVEHVEALDAERPADPPRREARPAHP